MLPAFRHEHLDVEQRPRLDAWRGGGTRRGWAQDYAAHNRNLMLHTVLKAMREAFGREIGTAEHAVNCHHNHAYKDTDVVMAVQPDFMEVLHTLKQMMCIVG